MSVAVATRVPEYTALPYPGCPHGEEKNWKTPLFTSALQTKDPLTAHYSPAASNAVVNDFVPFLHHYQGDFGPSPSFPSGRPFDLLPWQEHEIFRPLFGWKTLQRARDADGVETDELIPCDATWAMTPDGNMVVAGECSCPRLYRALYMETPKKNGKTQVGAAIAGYMAFADGEPAANVYTYAADKDQAKLAFDALSFGMFYDDNPFEPEGIKGFAWHIELKRTGAKVLVQSSSVGTKHGPNAHCIIFDELHAQKTRELWDVVTPGVAARRQPLVAALTTAGWDRNSVCWEQHEHTRHIAEKTFQDPSFLGVIWAAPEDADWTDEQVWRDAAPSLGVTVSIDFYRDECIKAKQMPLQQNAFRQLFLSQWTQQAVRFIPLEKWDECNEPLRPMEKRDIAYGGIDISATTDLTAFALIFPREDETFDLTVQYYMPEENIRAKSLRDRVPYQQWIDQKLITTTPGATVKYSFMIDDIMKAKDLYNLREIGYDAWNTSSVIQDLEREYVNLVPMGQGFKSMTTPIKEMLGLVLTKQIRHGANPVLRWNVDSAAAEMDPAGNVKLNKAKSAARIDGLIAGIIALDSAIRHPLKRRKSIYMRKDIAVGETVAESKEAADAEA